MTTNHTRAQRPSTETETTEVQQRRTGWTATEKLAILSEYESYPHGDPRRGALLRRVGAYTSHISKWRKQRARGALAHLAPLSPGRKPQPRDPLKDELAQLQREVARLQARLQQAETVIEIQKKLRCCLARDIQRRRPTTPDALGRQRVGANGGDCAGV